MKVLVVGSLTGLSSDAAAPFKIACQRLGKALSKRGHSLLVCSNNPKHADPHVLDGFIELEQEIVLDQSITVTFGDPADNENTVNKFYNEKRIASSRFAWHEIDTSGDYPFNRIGVIKDADAIIIIGGQQGTAYMSSVAYAMEKTLVPLYYWMGQNGNIWYRLEAALKQNLSAKQFRYISSGQASEKDWEGVVEATEALYTAKQKHETARRSRSVRRVLSIDGGGIRGILPALFLHEFEQKSKRPTRELFDLVIGTSTGGIIGLALTQQQRPYSAKDILDIYIKHSNKIFGSPRKLWSAISKSKYSNAGLKDLGSLLFDQRRLSETSIPTAVTAYDIAEHRPYLLRSWDIANDGDNYHLWEAALATSAAPTYFPPVQIGNRILIDGGVFANNPSAIAFSEARKLWPNEEIVLISLGTGITTTLGHSSKDTASWGAINWIGPLIDIMFDGSSDSVHSISKSLTSETGYYRFQITLHPELGAMDRISPEHLSRLRAAGSKAVDDQQNQIAMALKKISWP